MTVNTEISISKQEKVYLLFFAFVLMILMVFNSINSINYFNPDEHYQIIEFAGYKQGKINQQDLAWEFEAQSRQAIQPFACYVLFEFLNSIQITNPIAQIRVLRILTGLFSVICIYVFVRSSLRFFKFPYRKAYIAVSFIAWFVPYYYVRFTSESVSQSLFLLAIALALSSQRKTYSSLVIGFILGITFYVRFQSLFPMVGLFIGLFFIEKYRITDFFKMFLGGVVALVIGMLIDKWFYGNWVFTPWTYFDQQILHHVASDFGENPFWFYLIHLFTFSTPVIGIFVYLSIISIPLIKRINTVYLVFVLAVAFLSVIPHKEFRFLIPVLNLLPFIVIYAIQELNIQKIFFASLLTKKWLLVILIVFNIGAIFFSTAYNNNVFTDNSKALSYVIARDYRDQNVHLLYFNECHPFKDDVKLKFKHETLHLYQHFIMPPHFTDRRINHLDSLSMYENTNSEVQLLYVRKNEYLRLQGKELIMSNGFRLKYISVPRWLDDVFNNNPALGNQYNDWVMYIFEKK